VTLPEGVEKTTVRKSNGKVYTYYYWNPGRGTDREGDRIKLPNADTEPKAFWAELERRQSSAPTAYPAGSIGDLIARYRRSDEFTRLSEGTQTNYEVTMRRFEAHDTWGLVSVRDLTPLAVQTARDAMKETPVMANQMLSVGRTIWDWAIPLGLAVVNPFDKVKDFDIPDRGHVPWPSWVVDYVGAHAWPDMVRMERLGIMTCQRGSDLIRMGPEHRDRNGLWCRPKKTRRRRRAFHIPLAAADALEIDRWAETPVTFTNS
jgi:integrase